jgi:hypothetical protein
MNVRTCTCYIWRTQTVRRRYLYTHVGFIIGFPVRVRKSCRFQISSGSLRFVRVRSAAAMAAASFYGLPHHHHETRSPQHNPLVGTVCQNPFEWLRARARLLARANEVQFFFTPRLSSPSPKAQVTFQYDNTGRIGREKYKSTSLIRSRAGSSPSATCVIVH